MSIQQLPSGSWRAQVYDPLTTCNLSVGRVLGGDSTFASREEAREARERAREVLRKDPALEQTRRERSERQRAESLGRRREEAQRKREAIVAKVARWLREGYEVDPETGCWLWQGSLGTAGYGAVRREGKPGGKQQAHRWFFERLVGPIPPSLVLDHLCENKRCVNPEHLDPVTTGENIRRALEFRD